MNKHDGNWLDDRLKMTVGSGRVEFDGKQWKQKYSAEYKVLISRTSKQQDVFKLILTHPLIRVAAVIAILVSVILITKHQHDQRFTQMGPQNQSPAEMMSVLSLSLAYKHGGLDEVDKQCKKAFELLGQRDANVSVSDLLKAKNGDKPERNGL